MYRIAKITDVFGFHKTDDASIRRIGCIVDIDESAILSGHSAYIVYGSHDTYFMTSTVKKVNVTEKMIVVETQNSKYYFERV